ncbi:MAG: DUF1836 domain-containing protein [Dorea sp.]
MTIDTKDLLNSILSSISRIEYVKPNDIPNIELYMDQVTTFMEKELSSTKRYEEDKILTKTMINNYAKNNLLPPPVKKKYSKEHVLIMIFIYYFKNFLSIKDIETMLEPITEKYFDSDKDFSITSIYEEVCKLEKSRIPEFQKEIIRSYNSAHRCFEDAPEEERDELQLFAFICNLSFDIYVKKQIVEKLLDSQLASTDTDHNGKKKKK